MALGLSWKSIKHRGFTVALTVISLSLGVALLLGVERMRSEVSEAVGGKFFQSGDQGERRAGNIGGIGVGLEFVDPAEFVGDQSSDETDGAVKDHEEDQAEVVRKLTGPDVDFEGLVELGACDEKVEEKEQETGLEDA